MNFTGKIVSIILSLCIALSMAACGTSQNQSSAPAASSAPVSSAAPAESSSEPEAEQKPVILAVSFGSSYNDTRDATIGAIEKDLQAAYPEYEVRRAFTAQTIIDILKEREGLEIDNVTEAMERLVSDGVKEVVIQPTHIMTGKEYDDVMVEIASYSEKFERFSIGTPLLTADADYASLIKVLADVTADYNTEGTAIVFMGHGTHHAANATYASLQQKLFDAGYSNYFVGTVEAEPSLDDVIALIKENNAKKVVLLPLMIVAGDHATNDMAGDEEDSWKVVLQNEGYEVECVLKGLGEYEGVREIVVAHTAAAMNEK